MSEESISAELLAEIIELRKLIPKGKSINVESLSSFTITEELANKLKISGVLIAEGVWKGVKYSWDEIKRMFNKNKEKLSNLKFKVEHEGDREYKDEEVGKHTKVELNDTIKAILYEGEITNPKAIEEIKNGRFRATSLKSRMDTVFNGKEVLGKGLIPLDNSLTQSPACKTCQMYSWEELSKDGESTKIKYFGVFKTEDLNNETNILNLDENKLEDQVIVISEGKVQYMDEELAKTSGNVYYKKCIPEKKEEELVEAKYHHIRIKNPDYFDSNSFRVISIGDNIKATIGCKKGNFSGGKCKIGTETQKFLLPKDKYTKTQAEAWVKSRKQKKKLSDESKKENVNKDELNTKKEGDNKLSECECKELQENSEKFTKRFLEDEDFRKKVMELSEEPKKEPEPKVEPKVEPKKEEVKEPVEEPKKEEPKKEEPKVEPKKEEVKEEKKEEKKEEPKVEPKKEEVKEEPKEEPKKVEPKKEEPKEPTPKEIIDTMTKEKMFTPEIAADLLIKREKKEDIY